jgi:hypothetical protein
MPSASPSRRSASRARPGPSCPAAAKELSLRGIVARLIIATAKKKGQHPSSATVLRMLREHDEKTGAAAVIA